MVLAQQSVLPDSATPRTYRAYLFTLVAALVVLLFLAAPWSLEHKAHAALHGLCAQRPSHSFVVGPHRLPFDARMTGIYGGFLGAAVYLGCRRRYLAAGLPTWPATAVLAVFVGAMAVDGFNSLFLDLGWWHPYEPDNRLRLATGLMTGVALAGAIFLLFGMALWKRPRLNQPVVPHAWEPFLMLAIQAPFALAVTSGASWLFVPLTLLLLVAAVAVVASLMLVVAVLLRTADNSFERPSQAQGYAVAGLLMGLAVMAVFGGGRYLLESLTNAPPLT
jgi:uncharacterized membrane protein